MFYFLVCESHQDAHNYSIKYPRVRYFLHSGQFHFIQCCYRQLCNHILLPLAHMYSNGFHHSKQQSLTFASAECLDFVLNLQSVKFLETWSRMSILEQECFFFSTHCNKSDFFFIFRLSLETLVTLLNQ